MLLAVAAISGLFIHVPYRIISPGSATALDNSVVSVRGAKTYEHRGNLLYLTVRVTPSDPNLYRYLFAHLDDDVSIIGKSDFQGCASDQENLRISDLEMRDSQDTAKTVALRRLGYERSRREGRNDDRRRAVQRTVGREAAARRPGDGDRRTPGGDLGRHQAARRRAPSR